MKGNDTRVVVIRNEDGSSIATELAYEGGRETAVLSIDGVLYHFERIERSRLLSDYSVDDDPDYEPKSDSDGYCYLLVPFSDR